MRAYAEGRHRRRNLRGLHLNGAGGHHIGVAAGERHMLHKSIGPGLGIFGNVTEMVHGHNAEDIPIVPMNHFSDISEDPQAWANGFVEHVAFPSGNTDVMPSSPIEMNSADVPPTVPAFGVGAHTEEILQDLGYTQEEIRQMIESGAAVG